LGSWDLKNNDFEILQGFIDFVFVSIKRQRIKNAGHNPEIISTLIQSRYPRKTVA
jgi:hypothetical protein